MYVESDMRMREPSTNGGEIMERRSGRQKKSVNYRQILANGSEESDDDFADPPPPKRQKPNNNKTQKTSLKPQEVATNLKKDEQKSKSPRLSREEKMYHRAIEQALQTSQQKTSVPVLSNVTLDDDEFVPDSGEVVSSDDNFSDDKEDSDLHSTPPPKSIPTKKQDKKTPSNKPRQNIKAQEVAIKDEQKSKRLSREEKIYHRAIEQALQASQQKNSGSYYVHEDELVPDSVSSNDNFSDDKEDSDFHSTPPRKFIPTKKQNKKTPSNKPRQNITKPIPRAKSVSDDNPSASYVGADVLVKTKPILLHKTTEPSTPKTESVRSSLVSKNTPTTSTGRRIPKWTPPSQVSQGSVSTFKSPHTSGSPVIRIGLSRHARVKPLHANKT